MADTISSLITGINTSKTTLVSKVKSMGLFTESEATTAKLSDAVTKINSINIHNCTNYTVDMGETYTIPAGYHPTGATITGGPPDDVTKVYKLQELTVSSPEPSASSKTVTLTSDGDPNSYYGISQVTINPLGPQYIKTADATISAGDVLSGKIAYGKNTSGNAVKITGSMTNRGAVTKTLDASTTSYTIPAGYHNGSGKVSITTDTLTFTPSKSVQVVDAPTGKVFSAVACDPIPNQYVDVTDTNLTKVNSVSGYKSPQILTGYKAASKFSDGSYSVIEGSMPNNGKVTETIDTGVTSYTIPAGYHDGTGTVSVVNQDLTITPTKSKISEYPQTGKVIATVTVNPIPDKYVDVTNTNLTKVNYESGYKSPQILKGYKAASRFSDGSYSIIEGSMDNNGIITDTLDGIDTTTFFIPPGYTGGGSITFDDSVIIGLLQQI